MSEHFPLFWVQRLARATSIKEIDEITDAMARARLVRPRDSDVTQVA